MRKSEYYGVNVPELGDRADITVVSQAIIDSENNQSGKVENMKATVSGTIISLTSETRQDALLKYYNGLAIQFISPVDASAGSSYKIKIGSLTEQPYNNKVDIKVGDIVQAIYGSTGFVSANTPIPRSSSVSSNSETTVATSKAVKQAYDKGKEGLDKANTKLDAGAVSVDYNTGKKIEDKIKEKLDKTAVINDLTTGGAYNALSGEMGKKLDADKPSKNKEETITNYWTFENKTPFIKFKKIGEQSLPSAGYSAFIGFGSSARPHELQINNLYDDGTVNIKSEDLKTENKNITKAINEVYDNQLGNTGILEVIYIQDSGTKTKGLGYVDKITKKVYLCINTNTDTSITSNFILATNVDTARKIDDMIGSSTKLELKEGDYFICSAVFIQLSSGMVFVSGTFRLKSNYTYNRKLPDWAIPKTKQNLFMTALSSASSQNVSTLGFVVDTDGYVKTEYGYSGNNVTGSWIYSIR